jgi:hypothetical protein
MAGLSESNLNKKKQKKCCFTGLHFTENDICIQSLKPFQIISLTENNVNAQKDTEKSKFSQLITNSRIEPDYFEDESKIDILDVLNNFVNDFDLNLDD